MTFKLPSYKMVLHRAAAEVWTVTLIETGQGTQIGGRFGWTATDVDAFNVSFGRAQFSDIEFVDCPFLPPLPFEDGAFGAIYGVSVLTP